MTSQKTESTGKSSYDIIDRTRFWDALALEPGMCVLDLGCGAGRYALPMARRIGPEGRVLAVDAWGEGIEQLKKAAQNEGLAIIDARIADARTIPADDHSIDLCLIATVLHDFAADGIAREVLREAARVLAPRGRLCVVEFKKQDGPPGPPRHIRMAVEDVAVLLQPLGFLRFSAVADMGPHLYATQFRRWASRVA